jgi:hypothetical protein
LNDAPTNPTCAVPLAYRRGDVWSSDNRAVLLTAVICRFGLIRTMKAEPPLSSRCAAGGEAPLRTMSESVYNVGWVLAGGALF